MRKSLAIAAAVAVLLFGLSALMLLKKSAPIPTIVPITMRYVSNGRSDGFASAKPVFWVTNHTDRTLMIRLCAVEIQTVSGWTVYTQAPLPGILYFTNAQARLGWLGPHQAGYGEMLAQRIALPRNTAWRMRASVAEQLEGVEAFGAGVASVPRRFELRRATGNTNFPVYPFGKDVSYYSGHHSEVLSDEVAPQ